jgi:hypothetical protein
VKATAAEVSISNESDSYYCQTWVINALQEIKAAGVNLCDEPSKYLQATLI